MRGLPTRICACLLCSVNEKRIDVLESQGNFIGLVDYILRSKHVNFRPMTECINL